jgi:hypothetical protein
MRWLLPPRAAVALRAVALLGQAVTGGRLLSSSDGRTRMPIGVLLFEFSMLLVGQVWRRPDEVAGHGGAEGLRGGRDHHEVHRLPRPLRPPCHNLEHEDMAMTATFEVV